MNSRGKRVPDDVRRSIVKALAEGVTQRNCVRRFGVSIGVVTQCSHLLAHGVYGFRRNGEIRE